MTDLLLPPRARLLHIGPPKTGTTALQLAASRAREALLAAGVRYPGEDVNHLLAVSGFMGHGWGWAAQGGSKPSSRYWDRVMTEIDADPERRVWISHEFVAESDDATAARFAEALGPRLHVAITLRGVAPILASTWQQMLKSGTSQEFDAWLRLMVGDSPDLSKHPAIRRRLDQGAVVTRWARTVGPDNVTVVVLDGEDRQLLQQAFSALLGLPDGLLALDDRAGANRGMSAAEAEVLRRANGLVRPSRVGWQDYERVLRNGAVGRILAARRPGPDEVPLTLPDWTARRAAELASSYVEAIDASGVRVVGDLAGITQTAPTGPVVTPETVPTDLAVELLVGAVGGGAGLTGSLQPSDDVTLGDREAAFQRAARLTMGVSLTDLVKVVGWRVRRRADVLTGRRRTRLR